MLYPSSESEILKWNITSFVFCEKKQTAFCEWDFDCISNNTKYTLPGISVIKFSDHKISFIQEYRMTHPPYEWQGDELKSE